MLKSSKSKPSRDEAPTSLIPYLPIKCEARVYCKRGQASVFRRWKKRLIKVKASILLIYELPRDKKTIPREDEESYVEAISLHGFIVKMEPQMQGKAAKPVLSLRHPTSEKRCFFFSGKNSSIQTLYRALVSSCARVDLSDFRKIKQIGLGTYGDVVLVQHLQTGEYLAMKMMLKSNAATASSSSSSSSSAASTQPTEKGRSPMLIKHVIQERAALEQARESPYISQLRYAFQDAQRWYLVMEYLHGGELFALRNKQPSSRFPVSVVCVWAAQLVSTLQLLHKKGIMHRDLKLENLLLDPQCHVKLTDFGLCKNLEVWSAINPQKPPLMLGVNSASEFFSITSDPMAAMAQQPTPPELTNMNLSSLSSLGADEKSRPPPSDHPRSYSFCGTNDYISPEMIVSALRPGQQYSYEIDWWALGVVLYELLVGCPPFNAPDSMQLFTKILQAPVVWPKGLDLPPVCINFVGGLLEKHPTRRIGRAARGADDSDTIRKHPFFAHIDWELVDSGRMPAVALPVPPPVFRILSDSSEKKDKRDVDLKLEDDCWRSWEVRLDGYSFVGPAQRETHSSLRPLPTVLATLTNGATPNNSYPQLPNLPEKGTAANTSVTEVSRTGGDSESWGRRFSTSDGRNEERESRSAMGVSTYVSREAEPPVSPPIPLRSRRAPAASEPPSYLSESSCSGSASASASAASSQHTASRFSEGVKIVLPSKK